MSEAAVNDNLSRISDDKSKSSKDEAAATKNTTNAEGDAEASFPPELVMKHPLQNAWTLWFYRTDRGRSWEDSQCPVITFNTVEDFWSLYNHIEVASKLSAGCDYSLFKEGIKPFWEDKRNSSGGKWVINLDKKQRMTSLDNFWLEVMLCLIGECFGEQSQYVNGAVVSIRAKGDRIGMWIGDATQVESIISIGKRVKELLKIDPVVRLGFEAHQDTMKKAGSTTKNRYSV